MATIATELKRRAEFIGGRAWGADKQKPRIYLQAGKKTVSAYFHFPKAVYESAEQKWDEFSGLGPPEFKVFIEDDGDGQRQDWKALRRGYEEQFRMKGLALAALDAGDEDLAKALTNSGDVDDGIFEHLQKLLLAGKAADARDLLTNAGKFSCDQTGDPF